jgi:hypothetical protein
VCENGHFATNYRQDSSDYRFKLPSEASFGRSSPPPPLPLPTHAAERDDGDQPVLEHPAVVVGMANYGAAWCGASTGVVRFVREPDNEHDPHALMVTIDGARMGYLPRQVAHALSAFVDS